MPTAQELSTAHKVLVTAAQASKVKLSAVRGGQQQVHKTENVNANIGLSPLLALTCAIIQEARRFQWK